MVQQLDIKQALELLKKNGINWNKRNLIDYINDGNLDAYVRHVEWGWNINHTENEVSTFLREKKNMPEFFGLADHKITGYLPIEFFDANLLKIPLPEKDKNYAGVLNKEFNKNR